MYYPKPLIFVCYLVTFCYNYHQNISKYFSIFGLVGNLTTIGYFFWTDIVHLQQDWLGIGNKNGGTPALQLPDDKGRRRGGENPAGGARGGGGVRGDWDFSPKKPGGMITINFCNQHLIWLPVRFVQCSKHWQLIAMWKWKWSGGPGWEGGSLGHLLTSLSLFSFDSFGFYCI